MNLSRVLLCTFILLTQFLQASADNRHSFKLEREDNEPKTGYCNSLVVLDMRVQKERIGQLRTGAFNRGTDLTTERPLDDMMEAYYNTHIAVQDGKYELVLVLYDLSIEDRPNGDEMGTFHFDGDFYQGENGKYSFLGKVDSIYEVRSGWDVTEKIIKCGQSKTKELLCRYGRMEPEEKQEIPETQLVKKRDEQKMSYPIYQTTSFRKGIYRTVDEFLQHQPSDTNFVTKIYRGSGSTTCMFYMLDERGKKDEQIKPNTYFAIYTGKNWYVPGKISALQMDYEYGDFIAPRYFVGMRNNAGDAVAAGLMFGMIGYAITANTSDRTATTLYMAKFDPVRKAFYPYQRLQ